MSMIVASGLIVNITPRQTAGADGPKSVRNVMTGRIGGWYQACPARREVACRYIVRNAEAAPGGGSAPLRLDRSPDGRGPRQAIAVDAYSVDPGTASIGGTEPAGLGHGPEEQQLIDLSERPADVRDRDPAQEGGQRRRFVRCEAPCHETAVSRAGLQPSPLGRCFRRARGALPGRGRGATSDRGDRPYRPRRRSAARRFPAFP